MNLYRVTQIEFVDRFNPECMSVFHDFIRILRERWKLSSHEVSKSYVYLKLFCEMRSSYCSYHNSSRALRPWAYNCYICKIFPFFIHFLTRICRHFDRIAHAWLPSCPRFLTVCVPTNWNICQQVLPSTRNVITPWELRNIKINTSSRATIA